MKGHGRFGFGKKKKRNWRKMEMKNKEKNIVILDENQAFKNYSKIEEADNVKEQHRLWLEDYHGLQYSIARNGKHFITWRKTPHYYDKNEFDVGINKIGRKKNRLVIEFDEVEGEPNNPKESFEITKKRLKDSGWGFIHSTHGSINSDYLWVEFTRDLSQEEALNFLGWIVKTLPLPKDARIDMNFCYDKKIFPVLFALHWKHSHAYELPVEFIVGTKIDYDSLNIPQKKLKTTTKTSSDGFKYQTYTKPSPRNIVTDKISQVQEFWKENPFFYDNYKIWWKWDKVNYRWIKCDEIDILGMILSQSLQRIFLKIVHAL